MRSAAKHLRFGLLYVIIVSITWLLAAQTISTPVVDFDTSLGKGQFITFNGARISLFDDCLYTRPGFFSPNWDQSSEPHPAYELYSFLKQLYQKNAPWLMQPAATYKIPPHIHQIWIKGELPAGFIAWQKGWQTIPGWNYTLWTDESIRALGLINQKSYDEAAGDYAKQADIARIEILYRFGGVYVDTDCQCLKPEWFDYYNHCYDFYAGIQPLNTTIFVLANTVIACAPHHPVMKNYLERCASIDQKTPTHISTGPIAFTKAFYQTANQPGYRDIVLPPTFFYPGALCASWTRPTSDSCRAFTLPESMAVHYWHGR